MSAGQRSPSGSRFGDGLPVHILGGLPTEAVWCGVDRVRDVLPLDAFTDFVGGTAAPAAHTVVLLPPHVETSLLVEDWEACGHLAGRFGPGARIGNVATVVDAASLVDQLGSPEPISAHGWGKTARDGRSVADIVVGQLESATHLLVTGSAADYEAIRPLLAILNPTAETCCLVQVSDDELRDFLTRPRDAGERSALAPSARVVPPWLALLQAESPVASAEDRFLYRRSLPFDPELFSAWVADPPSDIVRGKGNVWLADRNDQSCGYSCAGSVHRVFGAGRWWASQSASTWPTCESARRRLFERWHPCFGDRRQEIAFCGFELDADVLCAELDDCLLSEEEARELVPAPIGGSGPRAGEPPRLGLH